MALASNVLIQIILNGDPMAVVFFYLVVLTLGAVFLLTVAHDEMIGLAHGVLDLATKALHSFDRLGDSNQN
ncbi:MAG: hypothetical protein WC028_16120 [Candidatus Obscuribacterales bacterium]|jgi:hypothetical protein|nr:hypothetical protein [bacterium]